MICKDIINIMQELAPEHLAESWDNSGFAIGDENACVKTILVALDVTDDVIDEAVNVGAELIVTHHPIIFSPIKKINASDILGRKIYKLIKNGINVYSAHTNLDIANGGTNDVLSDIVGLKNVDVLEYTSETEGIGRIGILEKPATLSELAESLKYKLGLDSIRYCGEGSKKIKVVALCTGSGAEFIKTAYNKNADVYITSDIKYHDAQKAIDMGIALIDATHYSSENIVVPVIAQYLEKNVVDVKVFVSKSDGQVFKNL